ncbi:protein FAM241B [Monodelphis domestica]|nr:protein FAM241B [Monodelphis domestica]XP_044518860.1 protein FAM241B [Gracilinanus agilis]
MVRILANGDIVQDDDPRARASAPFRNITSRQNFFTRGEGQLHGGPAPNIHHLGPRPGAHRSPFSDINQQLVNLGFPLWHLGDQVVEPVMSILLLFLVMMLGVRGLLLVGLVYMVSQLSLR